MEQDVKRKCIVSGELKDKKDLLRFVSWQGHLVPDFRKKLEGKGIYVTNSKQKLQTASAKGLFRRAAKRQLEEEGQIVEIVESLMLKRGLEFLNLAKKAGSLVIGLDKVLEKLKQDKVEFIVEANDAGDDGRKKIAGLKKNIPVFEFYNTDELDKALDKVNTVHAAFLKGNMANAAHAEFDKIKTFFEEM